MIEFILYLVLFLSALFVVLLTGRYMFVAYLHQKNIDNIFEMNTSELLTVQNSKFKEELKVKLMRAGLSKKDFTEIIIAAVGASLALLFLTYTIELSPMTKYFLWFLSFALPVSMPILYLEEQIKARIKRIDNDLAIFIDLLIIILEGGGGLNNAIDKVTTDAKDVLGKDLLYESSTFKHEFITYGGEIAYANLANRTGSEAIGTIVGFMKLSEETGIGVKTIFENQADDIKNTELMQVEKKAATMNISLTFTMFIFIIPAVIAMIAFPMSAGALMSGF